MYLTVVKIKDALIELKKGNITAEIVNAIVNSTNEDVNLKNGLSQVHDFLLCGVRTECLPSNANS